MCNEYAREIEMGRVIGYMEEMKDVPPFEYEAGRIPNDIEPKRSIKILIARLGRKRLIGETMTWAWKTPVANQFLISFPKAAASQTVTVR
jgi:hypothetical protein